MKYYIFTLGCQMNENDSERIAAVLENLGFTPASEHEADLIIANLCSVRQKAIDRVWGKLKNWSRFKPKPKIFLTGCILPSDRRKFAKRVDGIFNIFAIKDFPTLLRKNSSDDLINHDSLSYFNIKPKAIRDKQYAIAFVPIMTGCDNFCSYCAVPYTRGREFSRSKADIIAEAKNLIKSGHRTIMLLGQNVNSYNPTKKSSKYYHTTKYGSIEPKIDNSPFIKLLKEIDNLPGDFKYSFMSSNPHDMSDKLIKTFGELKKWDKTLHVAMQSGDDEILKKMNRKCTSDQFLKLVSSLRSQVSDLILTTDIIVGFPGESKKAFLNTVKVCKKARFDKAYVSQYSPRPGTASAKMKDDIPRLEKKRRWKILNDLINQ